MKIERLELEDRDKQINYFQDSSYFQYLKIVQNVAFRELFLGH